MASTSTAISTPQRKPINTNPFARLRGGGATTTTVVTASPFKRLNLMDPPTEPHSDDVEDGGSTTLGGRDWAEMSPELLTVIMSHLKVVDRLKTAQRVCSSWRKVCRDPYLWRSIDIRNNSWVRVRDVELVCKEAVDRSCGGLVSLTIEGFGTDQLLDYIANGSSQLKHLQLISCNYFSEQGFSTAVQKFLFLEELEISYCSLSKEALLVSAGRYCPFLRSLKLNQTGCRWPRRENDREAMAIAENMPGLHHLQIFGNKLTNHGLQAILNGCTHLESLDLRQCFNVLLEGDLEKRCRLQIKDLRCPEDSTDDYPYNAEIPDYDSSEEDYPSGFSDPELSTGDDYYEFSADSELSDAEFY
ncbi:F-box protein SKIP19 [Linum grandiflorum]